METRTFKIRRIGETNRERKRSVYGEGGRAVGGEARRRDLKNKATQALSQAARQEGLRGSMPPAAVPDLDEAEGLPVDELMDGMFAINKEVRREVRSRGEREKKLIEEKERIDILQDVEDAAIESPKEAAKAGEETEANIIALERTKEAQLAERKAARTPYSQRQAEQIAAIMGLPGVICNNCPIAETCPARKDNATCAYEEDLAGLTARDAKNLLPRLELFADLQAKRAMRGVLIEARQAGGQLDANVTRQLEIAAGATARVMQIRQMSASPQNPAAAMMTNATGGGLISKLLSSIPRAQGTTQTVAVVATQSAPCPFEAYASEPAGEE